MEEKHEDHTYAIRHSTDKTIVHDHCYSMVVDKKFSLDMEYADDMTSVTNDPKINDFKRDHTKRLLKQSNLSINIDKTETFEIKRSGNEEWKNCKLLGSLLDTENDIQRRKGLAVAAINTMKNMFYGKVLFSIKLRAFNCYVSSIFLYNCELWTLTETTKNMIDAFHRRLLRTACLNIKWPKVIKNDDLYTVTKAVPWSHVIAKRQFSWFGHLARLPDDTPAKLSLDYVQNVTTKKPRGRQKTTWISMITANFSKLGLTWNEAYDIAKNRNEWKDITRRFLLLS